MKEHEIRPQDLFAEYLRLSAEDAKTYFSDKSRKVIPCPGCGSSSVHHAFVKHGFAYQVCSECETLFQSPRPSRTAFTRFYKESPSSKYWAEVFFPAVAEVRRKKIFAPRVIEVSRFCREHGYIPEVVMSVGGGHGLFLEEWKKLHPEAHICIVEPNPSMAKVSREKGMEVLEAVAEETYVWHDRADLVTCFEVIEHVHDPLTFIKSLRQLAKPGGWILVTGLGVEGFDIQILWDKSNSVSPPHHLNFMSVEGYKRLFARAQLVDLEVETPGKLDMDIVANAIAEGVSLREGQRFVETLLSRGERARAAFQEFLSGHQLSSHCWIWARKPKG